jgi:hypothetical protein
MTTAAVLPVVDRRTPSRPLAAREKKGGSRLPAANDEANSPIVFQYRTYRRVCRSRAFS